MHESIEIVYILGEKGGTGKTTICTGIIYELIKRTKSNNKYILAINLDESSYSLEVMLKRYSLQVPYRDEDLNTIDRALTNEIRNQQYKYIFVDFKGSELNMDNKDLFQLFDKSTHIIVPIIPSTPNSTTIIKMLKRFNEYKNKNKIVFLFNQHGYEKHILQNLAEMFQEKYSEYNLLDQYICDVTKHSTLINIFNTHNRNTLKKLLEKIKI